MWKYLEIINYFQEHVSTLGIKEQKGKFEIMKAQWKIRTVPLRGEECGSI